MINICEICEIIMDREWKDEKTGEIKKSLYKSSTENPNRCEDCLHYEDRIKNVCGCGKEFTNTNKYFIQNGNFCPDCMQEVNLALKR